MNHNDTLAFCAAAESLLAVHANDGQITGRARENEQRDFARHAFPTLALAIEKIRNLVGEVASLRTGVNESEGALLRMWKETQAEVERLRETTPCGHPAACVCGTDEGMGHCAWCEDKARWLALLDASLVNAERYRALYIEGDRKLADLEARLGAEIRLARMRATVGGGSVL